MPETSPNKFITIARDGGKISLVVGSLIFAFIYFLMAEAGLMLALSSGSASPVWPPVGFAVAVLWVFGQRYIGGLALGYIVSILNAGLPLLVTLGMGIGNILEATVAVYLLNRFNIAKYPLESVRSTLMFIALIGFIANPISATFGMASLTLGGIVPAQEFVLGWLTWWTGNLLGVIVLGLLLISWLHGPKLQHNFSDVAGAYFMVMIVASVSTLVFYSGQGTESSNYPIAFVLLPILTWTAFRFSGQLVTTSIAVISFVSIIGTAAGYGPFQQEDLNSSLLLVQGFIAVIALTTLLLAAILSEHRKARLELTKANEKLSSRVDESAQEVETLSGQLDRLNAEWAHAFDYFADAVLLIDLDDTLLRANRAFYDLIGKTPEECIGRPTLEAVFSGCCEDLSHCACCTARSLIEEHESILEAEDPLNPFSCPVEFTVRVIRDDKEAPIGMIMGIRDLTNQRQSEQELNQLNQQLKSLLHSTDEGIYGINLNMQCTFVNLAAEKILGYSKTELLGQNMFELLHKSGDRRASDELEINPLRACIDSGQGMVSDNINLRTKDSGSLPVRYSVNPVKQEGKLTGAVIVFSDITEAQAMARHLDYLATHDTLTGLHNRLAFEDQLQHAIADARNRQQKHALCYLDLDQFKVVNDTCGHMAGDELLRQLATLLHERLRKGDAIGRLGGDEFGILLHNTGRGGALMIAETIREIVADFRFVWADKSFTVGVSIGLAMIDADTPNLEEVLRAADAACYVAKDTGRNRVHMYVEKDTEMVRRHGEMQWVSKIQRALRYGEFELKYQEIAPTSGDKNFKGFEILIQMRTTENALISPGAFLPAAERYNLIAELDRWVVSKTFEWFKRNPKNASEIDLCTINLSGQNVGDSEFMHYIVSEARRSHVPISKICFEVTETAAVANLSKATKFIQALKKEGFQFALDDFGSGMSSFGYLRNLPVDYLKIDGNFVRGVADDEIDYAMVSAIHQVGAVMGLKTIAEFVENEVIISALRDIGIDYVQGYGIAYPDLLETLNE